ncbi:uncharacterized protein LOC131294415 [Anopheles ziemanni]|uniref:uncharacterized protein LOC131265079 n=1 Tax=Anopheles coustani TaxID=139045 RepID=UPI00265991EA|nr:uncharacterized protein LOC131265079 [Anopheles coustani]XP_058178445.1 uncharacterized protein LOC131294415 [Anopheles ziemanni]
MLCQRGKKPIPTGTRFEMSAVLLIAIAGLVGKVCPTGAATLTHTPTDSLYQRYFDAVAPEDRENFIKYHLDKALEQRIPNYRSHTPKDFEFTTFQDAQEPEDFAINLLDHFMSAFGLDEVHVFEFVALNVICFPSGWCFNPDDVGNICCPF